jgi:hypothetical protein
MEAEATTKALKFQNKPRVLSEEDPFDKTRPASLSSKIKKKTHMLQCKEARLPQTQTNALP